MKRGAKRQQIIAAADDLFYRKGYECTSFADITAAVEISRGNLYHHFKVKDDILDAVIEARQLNIQQVLDQWDAEGACAIERIECYIKSLRTNWPLIREHGCPVGSLCTELAKLDHTALQNSAALLSLFKHWLKRQFEALNTLQGPEELAMDLLCWGQGVAVLSSAYKDIDYVEREVQQKCRWLQSLQTA
ncbi:MAG: TetR/AcrR family transcriptional regulator [Pseudomonadales bacterium]